MGCWAFSWRQPPVLAVNGFAVFEDGDGHARGVFFAHKLADGLVESVDIHG